MRALRVVGKNGDRSTYGPIAANRNRLSISRNLARDCITSSLRIPKQLKHQGPDSNVRDISRYRAAFPKASQSSKLPTILPNCSRGQISTMTQINRMPPPVFCSGWLRPRASDVPRAFERPSTVARFLLRRSAIPARCPPVSTSDPPTPVRPSRGT